MQEGAANAMAFNSANPTSRPVIDRYSIKNKITIFKELSENFGKLFALLVPVIATLKTNKGDAFFKENHMVIEAIIVVIVLYFLASIIGAVLQLQIRNSLPLLILFVLGSVASVLVLSLISSFIAWITSVLFVIAFVMIAYDHYQELPERIKKLIESFKPERVVLVSERIKQWIENYKSENARLPV